MYAKKSKVSGKISVLVGSVEKQSTQTDVIREKLPEEGPVQLKNDLE